MSQNQVSEPVFTITSRAASHLKNLFAMRDEKDPKLRVLVEGGGCSGFQYRFDFCQEINGDDKVFSQDGIDVVIDMASLDLLGGSELDYVEELIGSALRIKNPNAVMSCGCGSSFSI